MLPDRVSNPGPLTYESGALPIALRGPAVLIESKGISSYRSSGINTESKMHTSFQKFIFICKQCVQCLYA